MADDLPIRITLDPTAAAQGAKKVVEGVAQAEEAAKKTQAAFNALTETFKRIADHERFVAQESAKAKAAVDNLAGSFKGLANAISAEALRNTAKQLDSLTRAIQTEQDVLKSIKGPIEQYNQQLQILNKLQREGKITASEHAVAVAQANKQAGFASVKAGTGSSGLASAVGGVIPSLGPAAVAGAALSGIAAEIRAWQEREAAQTRAADSLLKYYDTFEQASAALPPHIQNARLLNATIEESVSLYGSVRDATAELYLTSQQQADITRNLGMLMKNEGRSLSEIAGVMSTLEFAMSRGSISGRELQTLMKQFPPIAQIWRDEFGMTTKELISAANAGELTRDEIGRMLTSFQNGDAILDKYTQRQSTLNEVWEKANGDIITGGKALLAHVDAMEAAQNQTISFTESVLRLTNELQRQHDLIAGRQAGLAGGVATETYKKMMHETGLAVEKAKKELEEYNKEQEEAARAARKHADEIERLQKLLFSPASPFKPGSNSAQWEIEKAQRESDIRSLQAADQATRNEALGVTAQPSDFLTPEQINASAQGNGKRYPGDPQAQLAAQQAEAKKLNDLIAGQLTNSVATLGDTIIDAAHGAEVSWTNTFENIAKSFEKMLVQALAFKLLTGSVTGAANASGGYGGLLGALGFATGGYIPPGGSGGTDSQAMLIKKSPWESLYVNTPGQDQMMRSGGGGGGVVIENRIVDGRELAPMSRGEETRVLNTIRKYPGVVKQLIE